MWQISFQTAIWSEYCLTLRDQSQRESCGQVSLEKADWFDSTGRKLEKKCADFNQPWRHCIITKCMLVWIDLLLKKMGLYSECKHSTLDWFYPLTIPIKFFFQTRRPYPHKHWQRRKKWRELEERQKMDSTVCLLCSVGHLKFYHGTVADKTKVSHSVWNTSSALLGAFFLTPQVHLHHTFNFCALWTLHPQSVWSAFLGLVDCIHYCNIW